MKKITFNPKQVRIFLGLLALLLVLMTLKGTRGAAGPARYVILMAILSFATFFIFLPRLFFPAYRLVMGATEIVGSFVFAVISTLIFFLILTPIAQGMKLFGKRFMNDRPDRSAPSYYEEGEAVENVGKQF